jgi:hypothetical protein
MADVTISSLDTSIPAGSNFIPYTNGSVTNKTLVSSITAACQPLKIVGASVSKTGSQTGVVNDTFTTVSFNATALWDTNAFYNGTNKLTVPTGYDGIYSINARLTVSTAAVYYKNSIAIMKNDVSTSYIGQTDTSLGVNGLDVAMTTSIIHSLVAGDSIKLRGYCQSFYSTNAFTNMVLTMVRIGTL